MKKVIFTGVVFFCAIFLAQAQSTHHTFWTKETLTKKVNEKWSADLELIHRRQDFIANNQTNLFQKPLLNSTRILFHYKIQPNFTLSLSPFAAFQSYPLLSQITDNQKHTQLEYRWTILAELRQPKEKWEWSNRIGIEQRLIRREPSLPFNWSTRLRLRGGLKYSFSQKNSFFAFDEVFFSIDKKNINHAFEHNRLGIVFSHQWNKTFKSELGYIFIKRLNKSTTFFDVEHTFMLNTSVKF